MRARYFSRTRIQEPRSATEAEADASIAGFDESNDGFFATWRAFRSASKLRDLSSVYTVLDVDNTYYIADKTGTITAYADADPLDPASPIVEKAGLVTGSRRRII